jgi:hypothetical protein
MKPLFVIPPLKLRQVGAQLYRSFDVITKHTLVFEYPLEPLQDTPPTDLIDPTPNPLPQLGTTRLKPRRGEIRAAIALDHQGLVNPHPN